MTDPLGLLGASQAGGLHPLGPQAGVRPPADGPSFKDMLLENLRQVNQLQQDATAAAEDLYTGRRSDVETVLIATAKADTAFRMLQQLRNKMMDAYEEVKQIRV